MLEMMYDYWEDCPPLHIMFAAFIGHKNKGTVGKGKKGGAGKYQDHSELLNLLPVQQK